MSGVRIAFSNKKGGVAKTTLSCLMASAIHYKYTALRVGMFDIDPLQNTSILRSQESEMIMNSSNKDSLNMVLKALENVEKSDFYDILSVPLGKFNIIELLKKYDNKYDFLFVETPGNQDAALYNIYPYLDFVFVPFNTSDFVLTSTEEFLKELIDIRKEYPQGHLKEIVLVKTMYPVDNSNHDVINTFLKWEEYFLKTYGIKTFKNPLFNSDLFKNIRSPGINSSAKLSNYINTLAPFPDDKKFSNISPYPLIEEIIQFIITTTSKT